MSLAALSLAESPQAESSSSNYKGIGKAIESPPPQPSPLPDDIDDPPDMDERPVEEVVESGELNAALMYFVGFLAGRIAKRFPNVRKKLVEHWDNYANAKIEEFYGDEDEDVELPKDVAADRIVEFFIGDPDEHPAVLRLKMENLDDDAKDVLLEDLRHECGTTLGIELPELTVQEWSESEEEESVVDVEEDSADYEDTGKLLC